MPTLDHIPQGFHTITPYLVVENAARLIAFVRDVFDAQVVMRMETSQGEVRHAQVQIGDSPLEMADATEHWPEMPGSLHVYVPDVDEVFSRAVAAGAEVLGEPQDQFYGERSASVMDSQGNLWHIATKTEDLTNEEMNRRAAKYLAEND